MTENRPPDQNRTILEFILAALAAAAILLSVWKTWVSPTAADPTVATGTATKRQSLQPRLVMGMRSAPVALVIVSDFECPFCAQFAASSLPEIRRSLVDTGRVEIYYRHFSIGGHRLAPAAAELAECSARDGKFWQVHDALFAAGGQLSADLLDRVSRSVGLKSWQRGSCPYSDVANAIDTDRVWSDEMGVPGTPYFFLGRRDADGNVKFQFAFAGVRPPSEFVRMVDSLIGTSQ